MSESKTKLKPSNGKTEAVIMDSNQRIAEAVKTILESVGEDPERDGLLETPKRVARALNELLEGYTKDLKEVVNGALFDVQYGQGEMIIVQDIPYDSMCEHHMLPFSGTAHVAYLPSDKIIGLSKIPRIVEMYARRLQVQERLTNQVADAIEQVIGADGVMVVFDGEHMCAALRGIKKKGMNMRTTAMRGVFATDPQLRQEFRELIQ